MKNRSLNLGLAKLLLAPVLILLALVLSSCTPPTMGPTPSEVASGESVDAESGTVAEAVDATLSLPAVKDAGLFLPEGDVAAGREVFTKMSCHSCHVVVGDEMPDPVAQPPVNVILDGVVAAKSKGSLADSVVAPSHWLSDWSVSTQEDLLSRMGDYSEAMTVRELIDLVEYLKSLG